MYFESSCILFLSLFFLFFLFNQHTVKYLFYFLKSFTNFSFDHCQMGWWLVLLLCNDYVYKISITYPSRVDLSFILCFSTGRLCFVFALGKLIQIFDLYFHNNNKETKRKCTQTFVFPYEEK